jgi:molybdate/tungstate transport system substrate-binding protein
VRDDCERRLRVSLQAEGSGSQEACRKVTELGRDADLLVLADDRLVAGLLGGVCRWRIDFATDALVLGVGTRAPHVAEAEKNWPAVVVRDDVRLARVDERLGPLGYRTLLALKLQERLGSGGLPNGFLARCARGVDDVERLVPLLKHGEADYALIYRSTGLAHGIRFIELDDRVNLAVSGRDYASAEVSFTKLKSGPAASVTVRGAPIVWTLTQPRTSEERAAAAALRDYVLSDPLHALETVGLRALPRPRFYGPSEAFSRFAAVAEYAGELK